MGLRRDKAGKPKPPGKGAPPAAPPASRDLQTMLERAWQQFEEATEDIATNGYVHETEKGYRYSNPAVNQRKEAMAQIAKLTQQLAKEKRKPASSVSARKR